jgi:hypothetical protein
VLWGITVAAETGGRVLADATEWLLRDNLNLAPRLKPGSYKPDEKRSSPYMAGSFNFPKNTEIEVDQERSARLDEPLERRVIARHRLEKREPNARVSAVKKPIVYYLDPGTPQPSTRTPPVSNRPPHRDL